MSLSFIIVIVLSLTASQAEIYSYEVKENSYEAKIDMLLEELSIYTEAKMNDLEKSISKKLSDTIQIKLENMMDEYRTLHNKVENLENEIIFEQNSSVRIYTNLNNEVKEAINKIEIQSRKADVMEKELQDFKSYLLPGIPQVSPSERTFAIVEINLATSAYNQLVKKKDSADITVAWTTTSGALADISKVTLNGIEVWSGIDYETSASFEIRHGGRYQMIVELCNKNGCRSSDPTEIIVADTDGSHLPPLETPISKTEPFKQIPRKVLAAYFMEWGVYDKQFPVSRVPVSDLTHLIYSLIPICGGNGINDSLKKNRVTFDGLQNSCSGREDFKVAIQDTWAALKMPLKDPSFNNESYMGNFGELIILKQSKPDLKMLMSVGGYTFSDPFSLLDDKTKRDTLIASIKDFLQTWKFFDGVDIMWLDPKTPADGKIYVQLMKELNEMLNELSVETGKIYELTIAISAKWNIIQFVNYNEVQKYIDHIFLMSYGFKDTEDVLGYDASLYAPAWNRQETYTADYATKQLLTQGVESEKIVLGIYFYGLGWTGVHSYKDDNPFSGNATGPIKGTWETGRVYYSQIIDEIAQDQWEYHYDSVAEAPYVFRNETGDLISFDNTRSTIAKAKYVWDNDLGGLFARGIDADNGDLLRAMHKGLENNNNEQRYE